jgi:PAS domain S-box-containing protein
VSDPGRPPRPRADAATSLTAGIDFYRIFDAAPGACLILVPNTPDFRIVDANLAYLAATTTTRAGLIGRRIFDAFPRSPRASKITSSRSLRASLETVLATRAPHAMGIQQYEVRQADGTFEERSWSLQNTPILGHDGAVIHIIHWAEDVTDLLQQTEGRREAEREEARLELMEAAARARLHTAEARLRRVLEQVPVGMAVLLGPTHVFEVANERYSELVGGRPLIGRTIREAFPELAGQGIYEMLDQTLASGTASYASERPVRLERGAAGGAEELIFNWIYEPLLNDAGMTVGVAVVATDVTELVRARENAARLASERDAERRQLQTVLEQSPIGLVIADAPSGRIRFMNAKVLEILGHGFHSEAVERYSEDWRGFHPDGRPIAAEEWPLARAVRQGETVTGEIARLTHRSGELVEISSNAAPVRDASGAITGGVLLFRDVTSERRADLHLRESERLQTVGTLAGGVAHEVNNQMTIVLGFAEFVLNDLGADHPQSPDVRQVLQAASRAAVISQQLLAFSRRQLTQLRNVDLAAIVTALAPALRHLLGSDKTLVVRVEPGTHDVAADSRQVEQVLINLVANARDAVSPGGTVTIVIEAAASRGPSVPGGTEWPDGPDAAITPGQYVMLAVEDDGHGMSPDTLTHMFEPFYTTKSVGQGTGLGLSMVHGIVKQHGGHVWAESEPGHGAVVRVCWPSPLDLATLPPDELVPAQDREPFAWRATVLFVEDEPLVRQLAARALEADGLRVMAAETGEDALGLVRAGLLPDVVVTDVVMPRMNGPELGNAIHALYPDLPILFVSGYLGDDMIARRVLPEGAAFLQKPFAPEALVRAVDGLLKRRVPAAG